MDEQYAKLDDIYDLPWNRMGPYLIGVVTGYILIMKLDCKLMLKRVSLVEIIISKQNMFFLIFSGL